MALTEQQIVEAAQRLDAAEKARQQTGLMSLAFPNMTMNDAYATWVEGIAIAPARAAFEAAALPAAAKVEIVVQAVDTNCCE